MASQAQNSEEPSLCENKCGYFGNPSTKNLCSKCYKEEYVMKNSDEEVIIRNEAVSKESHFDAGVSSQSSSNSSNVENRCSFCNKKVGLTGFRCKCGHTFCSIHRYSDKHGCVFDYKGTAQDAIARANPVVKADKIDKI